MSELDFILGLMRQNTDALGFIPGTTVEQRYLARGRYLIQKSTKPVGYLLHGNPQPGGVLTIAQAVIEYDLRQNGHGMDIVVQLIERAKLQNCRAITLRCAEDLSANHFWQVAGFEQTAILTPSNRRQRSVYVYTMDLWPTLFAPSAKGRAA